MSDPAASDVVSVPPAPSGIAADHFGSSLAFETDCADVHAAIAGGRNAFVLVDVRGTDAFAGGHCTGAVNLPRAEIGPDTLAAFPDGTVFVVYCNGPHCNGADKAALRLAQLGRPVKKMIGGVVGWREEGFPIVRS